MGTVRVALGDVLSGLGQSFHSLDVRAAVCRRDSPGVRPVLVGIRISARPLEVVKQRYRDLEARFGSRRTEAFWVLFEAFPLAAYPQLAAELLRGAVTIEGEHLLLPRAIKCEELLGVCDRYPQCLRPWGPEAWPGIFFSGGASERYADRSLIYNDQAIAAKIRGVLGLRSAVEMVQAFLEVKEIGTVQLDLFVHVEMPAKISKMEIIGQTAKVSVAAEKSLRDFQVVLTRKDRTGTTTLQHTPLRPQSAGEEGPFVLLRVETELRSGSEDDLIYCALTHERVPELDEETAPLRSLRPAQEKNPLLECLRQFWLMEDFYQRVERPHETPPRKIDLRPQDAFQKEVARLFSLAGFQAIDLERDDKLYHPGTNVERATADILAYHQASKMLIVGACTIGVPKTEDYDKLAHAAAILGELFSDQSEIRLVPVLFSGQEGESALEQGVGTHPVRLMGSRELRILTRLIEDGDEVRFIAFLGFPVGSVLRESSEYEG